MNPSPGGVLLVEWSASAGVASTAWAHRLLTALAQTPVVTTLEIWLVLHGFSPAQVLALRAQLGALPARRIILAPEAGRYQAWQQGLGITHRLCLGGDELSLLCVDEREGRQRHFYLDAMAQAAASSSDLTDTDVGVLPAVSWLFPARQGAPAARSFSAGYFALPVDFVLLPLPPASASDALWRTRLAAEPWAEALAGRPCILLGDGHSGEAERLARLQRGSGLVQGTYLASADFAERQELYGLCGLYLAQSDTLEDRLSTQAAIAAGARVDAALASPSAGTVSWDEALAMLLPTSPRETGVSRPESPAQLFVDVSELIHQDAGTGIQRVVSHLLAELLARPPAGYRVQAVYARAGEKGYRCCADLAMRAAASDPPLAALPGDRFLGLDFTPAISCQQAEELLALRAAGVHIAFVLYDLLPVLMPAAFPAGTASAHARWLQLIAEMDEVLCISQSVAREFQQWAARELRPARLADIGWFHLGADLAGARPDTGQPADADERLQRLRQRPSFLVVGTLEPRKGIAQIVAAFEQLWQRSCLRMNSANGCGRRILPLKDKRRFK